jgi:hypothetical protein
MFAPDTQLQEVRRMAGAVRDFCAGFDVDSIPGPEVRHVHRDLAQTKKLVEGALTLLARRVEDSGAWQAGGARSAAEYLARSAGTSTAAANEQLRTSRNLGDLPATEAAVKNGDLSADQAAAVADGASVNPAAEQSLLDSAKVEPLGHLRDRSRRAKADADPDREATQARIHAQRRCRRWIDGEGAYNLSLRTTAKAGAELDAALAPFIDAIFKTARQEGRREQAEAYAADALHQLVTHGGDGKKTTVRESKVIALISHDALVRGSTEPGETCELAGIGPVPVSTVQDMLEDAFLAAVVTNGVDVFNVAHLGRKPTAHQRTALEARGYRCEVPGCTARHALEIDHTDDWAATLRTKLDRLGWLCPHHHQLKTRRGHRLEGPVGNRRWYDAHGTLLAGNPPDPPPE